MSDLGIIALKQFVDSSFPVLSKEQVTQIMISVFMILHEKLIYSGINLPVGFDRLEECIETGSGSLCEFIWKEASKDSDSPTLASEACLRCVNLVSDIMSSTRVRSEFSYRNFCFSAAVLTKVLLHPQLMADEFVKLGEPYGEEECMMVLNMLKNEFEKR